MTLRTLINNGLLNNCTRIHVGAIDAATSFKIENDFLILYFEDREFGFLRSFPLDNEVKFDKFNHVSLRAKDSMNAESDLCFMISYFLNLEKFK